VRILRYQLSMIDMSQEGMLTIAMPEDTTILTFGYQSDRQEFSVWAVVDETKPLRDRTLLFLGTGFEVPEIPQDGLYWHFVNSEIMPDGFHIFHLFELVSPKSIPFTVDYSDSTGVGEHSAR